MITLDFLQVFQRRQDGSVDFYRNWTQYASGFGDVEGEFWLGNENIHAISNASGKIYQLRVDLNDGLESRVAQYASFAVDGSDDNYRIHLGVYISNSSDSGGSIAYSFDPVMFVF